MTQDYRDLMALQEDLINRMNQCAFLIGSVRGGLIAIANLADSQDTRAVLIETEKLMTHMDTFTKVMFYRNIDA